MHTTPHVSPPPDTTGDDMRSAASLGSVTVLLIAAACGRPIDPVGTPCATDTDCLASEACSAGVCTAGGVTACVTDLDCDPNNDEVCSAGVCAPARGSSQGGGGGGACTATAECPIDSFCNTAIGACAPLLDGWCRQTTQCPAEAAFCSNVNQGGEAVPGRCVECLADADCNGGTCQAPGVCVEPAAGCPINSSAVVGGGCRCNSGFEDDGAGGCRARQATPTDPGPTDPDPTDPDPTDPPSTGESCTDDFDCWFTVSPDYMCGTAGECVCDIGWMESSFGGGCGTGNVDAASCTCRGSSGGGGGQSSLNFNAACEEDFDCDADLVCLFGAGAGDFDLGSCKRTCDTDADCASAGLECMEDVLADGSGICATVQTRTEQCETSVYAVDIGSDLMCDGGGTAVLDCFASRCEQVCNWTGRTGAPLPCATGTTCGSLQFRAEAGSSVAVCQ